MLINSFGIRIGMGNLSAFAYSYFNYHCRIFNAQAYSRRLKVIRLAANLVILRLEEYEMKENTKKHLSSMEVSLVNLLINYPYYLATLFRQP